MSKLEIIESGTQSPQLLMARDAELLGTLRPSSLPCLHHYDWLGDSLTYGYFCKPDQLLNMDAVRRDGIQMARRPTGGGLLFHLSDLAFSICIPATHYWYSVNTLQNYAVINQVVLKAVASWMGEKIPIALADAELASEKPSFCMVQTTRYDLVLGGKKIGGAAQRRTNQGILHQATLYLAAPPMERIETLLHNGQTVVGAMQRVSQPLLDVSCTENAVILARNELRAVLRQTIEDFLENH